MKNLVWSSAFVRAFKRLVRQNPQLRFQVEETLQKLAEDPFSPSLHSHKLKGDLEGIWSCSIDYSNRLTSLTLVSCRRSLMHKAAKGRYLR